MKQDAIHETAHSDLQCGAYDDQRTVGPLSARYVFRMDTSSNRLINGFSAAAATVSFIAEPVPAVDVFFIIPAQFVLAASLAKHKGMRLREVPWGDVAMSILKINALGLGINLTIGRVPLLGNVVNAATTFLLTRLLGHQFAEKLDRLAGHPGSGEARPA